jgi:hypothetical protein
MPINNCDTVIFVGQYIFLLFILWHCQYQEYVVLTRILERKWREVAIA